MVIVLLAHGFEELEALTPVDILRRNDIDVRTVSVADEKIVTGTHGIQITADLMAEDVPADEIEMLIIPGGMPGVKNLDASPSTHKFIDAAVKNGGHLAAICAAPSIFGKHGMLTNVKATCFPGFEDQLIGATVVDTDVITDGIFTTARDYKAASLFSEELIRILKDKPLNEYPTEDFDTVPSCTDDVPKIANSVSSEYCFPSTDLLSRTEAQNKDELYEEINKNTATIIDTLASFNVTASIKNVELGPRVARYEIVPARGTKVTSVTKLFDDIALNLCRDGIRMEAPIPGRSGIGLEIPHRQRKPLKIRELLEDDEFTSSKSNTIAAIGQDVAGNNVYASIEKFPHTLIAGATGMGKSICINSMLTSIFFKAHPDDVKLILIDPKKVEFKIFAESPHLLVPVITDANEAVGAITWALNEMNRRLSLIEANGVRNISAYNELAEKNGKTNEKIPKIIIVIDELNDLMMQVKNPIEDLIMILTQRSRAAGIHLIIGTQRPDAKVITGFIKANVPTRISFKVSCLQDSKNVLEMTGAERLLDSGDMLFKPVDKIKPIRVQGAFISDTELFSIINFIKKQYGTCSYDGLIYDEIKKEAANFNNKSKKKAVTEKKLQND